MASNRIRRATLLAPLLATAALTVTAAGCSGITLPLGGDLFGEPFHPASIFILPHAPGTADAVLERELIVMMANHPTLCEEMQNSGDLEEDHAWLLLSFENLGASTEELPIVPGTYTATQEIKPGMLANGYYSARGGCDDEWVGGTFSGGEVELTLFEPAELAEGNLALELTNDDDEEDIVAVGGSFSAEYCEIDRVTTVDDPCAD